MQFDNTTDAALLTTEALQQAIAECVVCVVRLVGFPRVFLGNGRSVSSAIRSVLQCAQCRCRCRFNVFLTTLRRKRQLQLIAADQLIIVRTTPTTDGGVTVEVPLVSSRFVCPLLKPRNCTIAGAFLLTIAL